MRIVERLRQFLPFDGFERVLSRMKTIEGES